MNKVRTGLVFLLLAASTGRAAGPAASGGPKERTVSVLEEALKTDPGNSELWTHLGFGYRKLGKIDQAQSAFEKAASLNPQATEAYYMLGLIYESKNDAPAAQKAWKSYLAAETSPDKRATAEKHIHRLSQ